MERGDTFPSDSGFKSKLSSENLSGSDLKLYLLMRFGYYDRASAKVGMSTDRLHQIFAGYHIPKDPKILSRISNGWEIDPFILAKIFARIEKERGVGESSAEPSCSNEGVEDD